MKKDIGKNDNKKIFTGSFIYSRTSKPTPYILKVEKIMVERDLGRSKCVYVIPWPFYLHVYFIVSLSSSQI